MTDVVSPRKRSEMMSGIRAKDTKPELLVRKALHAKGFRYRLHDRRLPGKPDLVLPKYNAVIFVHGCFWHGHDCHLFKWPKSREEFWRIKIKANQERDRKNRELLLGNGWRVAEIWECTIKSRPALKVTESINFIDIWLRSVDNYLELKIKSGE